MTVRLPSKNLWIMALLGCLVMVIGLAILFPALEVIALLLFAKAAKPQPPAPKIVSITKQCSAPTGVRLPYLARADFRIDRANLDVAYLGDGTPVSLTGGTGVLPALTPAAAPVAVTRGFWRLGDSPQRATADGETGRFLRIDEAPEVNGSSGRESIISPDGRFAAYSESDTVARRENRYIVSVRRIGTGEEVERIELRNAMTEQLGWLSDRHVIVISSMPEQRLFICNLDPEADAPPVFQFTDQPAEFLGIDARPRTVVISQPGAAVVSGQVRWDGGGIMEAEFDADERGSANARRFRLPRRLDLGSLIPWLRIDGSEVTGKGLPIRTAGGQAAVFAASGSRITTPPSSAGSHLFTRLIAGQSVADPKPVCRVLGEMVEGPCVLRRYETRSSEGYTELDYLGAERRRVKVFGPSANGGWRHVADWNLSPNKPPSVVAITPYMTVGRDIRFTALASDTDGAADIARVEVKIAFADDDRAACAVALDGDERTAESPVCRVESQAALRASTLFSQEARVQFKSALRGRQNVFVRVIDNEGAASAWRWMASWKAE